MAAAYLDHIVHIKFKFDLSFILIIKYQENIDRYHID